MLICILTTLYISLLVFFLVMCFPRLKCWTYAFKKQEPIKNPENEKIAVLIPARNESASVGTLFECLSAQTYPRELFDVHVIVADENDATLEMARERGFITHVAADQACKSDALDFCLQKILARNAYEYAAYIIIDADCALEPNYIEEMNNALVSGADIICSKKKVKNYFFGTRRECTMSACCNAIIWTLIDNMGNSYKSAKGYPCFTVGTGLMLRANVIRDKNGWPYKATLTEDMELMHEAAIDHRKFFYYAPAVLYMEEAKKLSVTNKRRRRWMTGVADAERIYRRKAIENCSFEERYYTSSLNHIYGYIGTSVAFTLIMAVLCVILAFGGNSLWSTALALAAVGFAVIYLSFFVMTVIAVLADRENIKLSVPRKIALTFIHPLFYMQYIFIVGKALLLPGKRKWEAIERVSFSEDK